MKFQSINLDLNHVEEDTSSKPSMFAPVKIQLPQRKHAGTQVTAIISTQLGVQGNILPMRLYRQIFPKNINDQSHMPKEGALAKSDTIFTAYGGTRIQHYATVEIP